jgi:hypothetical protein
MRSYNGPLKETFGSPTGTPQMPNLRTQIDRALPHRCNGRRPSPDRRQDDASVDNVVITGSGRPRGSSDELPSGTPGRGSGGMRGVGSVVS